MINVPGNRFTANTDDEGKFCITSKRTSRIYYVKSLDIRMLNKGIDPLKFIEMLDAKYPDKKDE